MNIAEFLNHVGAEKVGGMIKAVIDGVHHVVAQSVDGEPQLTDAGRQIKQSIEDGLTQAEQTALAAEPAVMTAAKVAEGAAIEAAVKDPALATILTTGAGGITDELIGAINNELGIGHTPAPETAAGDAPGYTPPPAAPAAKGKGKKA